MFLDPKTPVTVSDLIRGMIVQSGNDACVTLAEVGTRFPGSAEANEAASQRTALSCP